MNEKVNQQQNNSGDDSVVTKNFETVFSQKSNKGFDGQKRYNKSNDISNH